jgi:hypothetical protein
MTSPGEATGVHRGPKNLDLPAGDVDREQHMVPNQPEPGDHLYPEEVHPHEHAQVSLYELRPGHPLPSLRCRVDAVLLQDPLDRVATDFASKVPQSALEPGVAPGLVLPRHPDHQLRALSAFLPRVAGRLRSACVRLILLPPSFSLSRRFSAFKKSTCSWRTRPRQTASQAARNCSGSGGASPVFGAVMRVPKPTLSTHRYAMETEGNRPISRSLPPVDFWPKPASPRSPSSRPSCHAHRP